ncbi:hypothetical protein O7628_16445 [Micromonospora sp. WMMD956]|uniref:hypothetical protein n=1 Tax=Micromonospora TaxID=1873 RepID=UPI002417A43B|nr:hypothetical protein [Micromonospora sp. WMMD956]MDG4817086.1 hypothetical protein [Micromonospora sp. WMMD956]
MDGIALGGPELLIVAVSGAAPDVPVLRSDAAALDLDLGEAPSVCPRRPGR